MGNKSGDEGGKFVSGSSDSSVLRSSISRRGFFGMVAGAGALCATRQIASAEDLRESFAIDSNPVDLLPRLTPMLEKASGIATAKLDLNGTWRFSQNPSREFWKNESDAGWSGIQVPGEWTLQGFTVKPGQPGGYRCGLSIPADWIGHRVKLRFDAVYSKAEVWMNEKPVGAHLGAFTPFEVDVTEAVIPGKDNVLALAVTSESLSETIIAGQEMEGHPPGGIIRKVTAFVVPRVHVSSLHVETKFDSQYQNAVLRVLLDVANESPDNCKKITARLTVREYGPDKKQPSVKQMDVELTAMKAGQVLSHVIEIPITAPKKWDAENPNLYMLECELSAAGQQPHSVQRRFGFRQISIENEKFLVNGQPIRLRGVSRQESHPLTGRTETPELLKQDMEFMLWANSNNAYTCAYLPDEEFLNLCDEYGVYALEEPGTCWVGLRNEFWKQTNYDDPKWYPYFLQPVLEMIERDRSHPSLITWMLADESMFGKNFSEVLRNVRSIEPTRPVHFAWDPEEGASGGISTGQAAKYPGKMDTSPFDLGSWHYPGLKDFATAAASKRPVIFDQSTHVNLADISELMTDPGLRDDWGRTYNPLWEKIWKAPSILGEQVFNFTDDVFLLPSGKTVGYGEWGVIDYWRRTKPELWHLKKTHTPIKVDDGPIPLPAAGQPLEVPVENRYDFINLSEVRMEWAVGRESGTTTAQVAPHQKGMIVIRPKTSDLAGKTLSLTFLRKDRMVDTYKLPIGIPVEPTISLRPRTNQKLDLIETGETIVVKGKEFEWTISKQTGQIINASAKGKSLLVGGPVLMILPGKEEPEESGYPKPRPVGQILNATCQGWKATSVSAKHSAEGVEITVVGQYKEAAGSYVLQLTGDGEATVSYQFKYSDTDKMTPRQIGMVLYAHRSCDTLDWKRKTQWSVYPEDHIGRPEGTARALRDKSLPDVPYRTKPSWPWLLDSNELGTNDFRATRRNILHASLKDASGHGVTVLSEGTHHTRAFLDGERTAMLVAWYSAPGKFWLLRGTDEIAGAEHMVCEKGTELKDEIQFSLLG